ncbi:MAG: TIGR02588 family protein [Cyanobacteria bacterium P01_F01_bin.53]
MSIEDSAAEAAGEDSVEGVVEIAVEGLIEDPVGEGAELPTSTEAVVANALSNGQVNGKINVNVKSQERTSNGKSIAARRKTRSLAERITLTICTVVLAAIVGLVLYDWQLGKDLPPAFQVKLTESAHLIEGRYYVPFTLKNTGGRIARTVQVLAELQLPDGTDETGEQQFDFLSGKERKQGGFVFEHNPQEGHLVVRVASFGLP